MHMEPNLDDPDGFYEELIELHSELSDSESQKVNAKLILMMANQIGDRQVLNEIMTYIRCSLLSSEK